MSFLRSAAGLVARSMLLEGATTAGQTRRHIKRWVSPTLRELAHRQKKLGPQKPEARSGFVEWNERSELFAFGKRLGESFELSHLQRAFTEKSFAHREEERRRQLGIEEADLQMPDNNELAEKGEHIARAYVEAFLQNQLPKVPKEGLQAIASYLLSTETLAHVSTHLGTKDLIHSSEYPPSAESLAKSLKAVIGALADSSGVERAFLFVRDFICTQLSQKDLLDVWTPQDPLQMLNKICQEQKLGEAEPRLIGDCGKNTVLAAYQVGIYADRQLLGKGFGEDLKTATETAAIDALQSLFDTHDNRRPFDFGVQLENKNVRLG
ncbi:39S ribosomal protein L44, mitochondrial isoform X1 [Drosophila ficusphila]|uniref:39S ribosomal protein L44, mitochondrial isoform X1 n=1 Tax=Drosophila ficusphila TaxID=30025 RepID=UPI0007E742F1|nr:39S ribosomal protein L44, mitochondrial isoform X1 [Drosophila ficusphila]